MQTPPVTTTRMSSAEFDSLLADARSKAKRTGMKPAAIAKAIAKVRGRR